MPLSVDEVRALIAAAARKPREQALILLLRYSGLSIRDAATLNRAAVHSSGELILRRSKSAELVTVLLPAEVLAALDCLPPRPHYFWTGQSQPETAVKYWRRRRRAIPPAPAARHVRGRAPARRRGDGRRQRVARTQQRAHHGAVLRPVESSPARPPRGAGPGSSPAGSDPAGFHTKEARGGNTPRGPRRGWPGNTTRFQAKPVCSCTG